MDRIEGKTIHRVGASDIAAWAARHADVTVDLGAGDGSFVRRLALGCPTRGAIGVDACAAGLRRASRVAPENALFVVGDALALPAELGGVARRATINFPWGSLLRGLVEGRAGLYAGLRALAGAELALDVRVNAEALAELGWALEDGSERIARTLRENGLRARSPSAMGARELRAFPSTWAKRLAFGRDPRAVEIRAELV